MQIPTRYYWQKLRTKTIGPYKVFENTIHTVQIRGEDVEDTLSLERITPAPERDPLDILLATGQQYKMPLM